jgi:hypothetical protein
MHSSGTDTVRTVAAPETDPASLINQRRLQLLFRKAAAQHAVVLVTGQSELQPGLNPRGNVTLPGQQVVYMHRPSLRST